MTPISPLYPEDYVIPFVLVLALGVGLVGLLFLPGCGGAPGVVGGDCYPIELDIQFAPDPEACVLDPEFDQLDLSGCCPDGFEPVGVADPSTVVCVPDGCA